MQEQNVTVISEGQRSLSLEPLLNGSRISLQPLAVESDCLTVLLDNPVSHRAGVVLEELLNLCCFLHGHKARCGHLNRERNTTHTALEFHYQNYKVIASTQPVGTSAVMYIAVLHMHVHVYSVVGRAGKWSVHE